MGSRRGVGGVWAVACFPSATETGIHVTEVASGGSMHARVAELSDISGIKKYKSVSRTARGQNMFLHARVLS